MERLGGGSATGGDAFIGSDAARFPVALGLRLARLPCPEGIAPDGGFFRRGRSYPDQRLGGPFCCCLDRPGQSVLSLLCRASDLSAPGSFRHGLKHSAVANAFHLYRTDRRDNVHVTLNYVLRQILFIMLPAAAGMLFLAKPIVSVVYQHGDFTEHTARMTALALACYAPGLVVFSLIKVLVPVFYARQDMRTPVKVGIACSLLNLVLNLILMWPLRHAGIAIATVAASTVHVIILALLVHRQDGSPGWRNIAFAACRLLIPTAVMTLAALATWNYILTIGSTGGCHPKLNAVIALTAAIACGGVVYLTAAFACRCREAHELLDVLRRRRG